MLDLARGDIGVSRHIRSALNILADSGLSKELEKQLREISKGKGSLRDLRYSESFLQISDSVLAQAREDQAAETPEERQRSINEGAATLESYRHKDPNVPEQSAPPAAAAPSPPAAPRATAEPVRNRRQSWRDVVVTPDEPDEDDLYFQERRERGWLQ